MKEYYCAVSIDRLSPCSSSSRYFVVKESSATVKCFYVMFYEGWPYLAAASSKGRDSMEPHIQPSAVFISLACVLYDYRVSLLSSYSTICHFYY